MESSPNPECVIDVKYSFIVPAYNEAFEIGKALKSIFEAANAVKEPFEVIVVNDDSNDETVAIARAAGARVIDVKLRKISAVRNAGAREAKGKILLFLDADTQISENTLRAALRAIKNGAVGGGAWVDFAEPVSWFVRATIYFFNFLYAGLVGWAAGCFVFARREAFEAVGGFDERLYACEEIVLSVALKRQGKFVLLREGVLTSARKIRMYSPLLIFPLFGRFLIHGTNVFRQRKGLEWWYEGKREREEKR